MAEIIHERARNGHVANTGVGIDLGGRATLDALDRFEPGAADRNFAIEQAELMPGRPAADIDIAAKTQGIDRRSRRGLHRRHRGEVNDLSLIHISEPTRLGMISYAVFCLK